MAQTVAKYLGYFGKKMCSQDLSKIAQSGHTEREDKISATFEAKSETNGIIRRQPNLGSSPETTWFSDFVSLTASIPPKGTSRTGGPNIATFIYLSIATLTRATKFFLIYEKFQLQRFYRKFADFAAGGRYGGLTLASQCVRKRTGSERRGGAGGTGRDHLKFEFWTFDINGVFFTIAAADRLSKTPAILLLLRHPVGAALPCPPLFGYRLHEMAHQWAQSDFTVCPALRSQSLCSSTF